LQIVRYIGMQVIRVPVAIAVPAPVPVWHEEAEDEALRCFSLRQVLVPMRGELFHISEEVKVLHLLLLVDFHSSCCQRRALEVAAVLATVV